MAKRKKPLHQEPVTPTEALATLLHDSMCERVHSRNQSHPCSYTWSYFGGDINVYQHGPRYHYLKRAAQLLAALNGDYEAATAAACSLRLDWNINYEA